MFQTLYEAANGRPILAAPVAAGPARKRCPLPQDTGTYILPVKQSLIRDARVMPGTLRLVLLLAGWAGKRQAIETTQGILGRHLGRSVRQIYRYLKDAVEEGYLTYAYVKNRIGMITGLRIRLNFPAIFRSERPSPKNRPTKRGFPARTLPSDTNGNSIYPLADDRKFHEKLDQICRRNNLSVLSG